jgi:hypothetical protein
VVTSRGVAGACLESCACMTSALLCRRWHIYDRYTSMGGYWERGKSNVTIEYKNKKNGRVNIFLFCVSSLLRKTTALLRQ